MSELVLLLLLILLQQLVEIQARKKKPITFCPSSSGAFLWRHIHMDLTCQLNSSPTVRHSRTGCATCATCLILFARIVPAGSATSIVVHYTT